MEPLESVGLNQKQQAAYLELLEHGGQSASELSSSLKEQRTNVYLITDELIQKGLVERDNSQPVTRFKATHPEKLQELLVNQQKLLARQATELKKALPNLTGLYQLHTASEGLAYFEGLQGYQAALNDMLKTSNEVCVFGTANLNERPDIWQMLQTALQKRALQKIPTRMILDTSLTERVSAAELSHQRITLKFWSKELFEGEIAIYNSTIVLTTYDERLISLVIKNRAMAATMQAVFNQAWLD